MRTRNEMIEELLIPHREALEAHTLEQLRVLHYLHTQKESYAEYVRAEILTGLAEEADKERDDG